MAVAMGGHGERLFQCSVISVIALFDDVPNTHSINSYVTEANGSAVFRRRTKDVTVSRRRAER